MRNSSVLLIVLLSALLWLPTFADSSTLTGTWVASREDGAQTVWTFAADGTMNASFDGMEGFSGTYKLDTSREPHAIDIVVEGETLETILEFSGNDSFRLEIGSVDVGTGRPEKFSDQAVVFERQATK